MGRLYRIIFLTILIPALSNAQTMDCEQTLAYATEEFNAGHFYSVPSILNECLKSFNRDQRQRAHLLLTQTYLLLDDPIGAERSFLEVLSANPEFIPDEQLHAIDIVYLSKRFTATPKFSWFVGAGSNVSPVRVIIDNTIFEHGTEQRAEEHKYRLRPGYNFGLGGEYSYNDNLKVRLEANFLQASYRLSASNISDGDYRGFIEQQTWVSLPLYLAYSDNVGRYRPYAYAGLSLSRLLVAKGSIVSQKVTELNSEDGESESFEVPSPDLDFLDRRNRLNQAIIFGTGVKYKIGLDFVFVDLRYSAGMRNIVNPDRELVNTTLDTTSPAYVESGIPMSFGHKDDYLRFDNLAITIGFLRPLYKPRELKRARTKGVLRKMKREK